MKNRFILVIGAAVVIFLLFAIVWWLSRSTLITFKTASPSIPEKAASPSPQAVYSWQGNIYAPLPAYRGIGYDPSIPQWAEWRRRRAADPKFEWKMPINFYGKVVDQEGQPVQEAAVRFQWTDMSAAGTTEKFMETDPQGLFSLTNEKGKRLLVFVSKDGYHAVDRGRASFEYAAFFEPNYIEPDSNKPVVFHLLKKNPAEPLVKHGPTLLGAHNDGTRTNLDLATGRRTVAGSGNLAVRITKGPKTQENRFDWTATVEGVGGTGLIKSDDEFMVMAPPEGYQPEITFGQKATDEQYQSQMQTKFYIKTGDGKYARIEMRVIPEYNERAAVDLTVYLNTSGSRNLEYDPSKVIQSP